MNNFPVLFGDVKKLVLSTTLVGFLIVAIASFWGLYVATQVAVGVGISVISTYFYGLMAWTIIVKKNIAWMGVVVVIKYSILIASIYFVWTYCHLFFVVLGLTAQLIISALLVAVVKSRQKSENLLADQKD